MSDPDAPGFASQREQWEAALSQSDRYGEDPSAPARAADEWFEDAEVHDLLELGAGQGRDTIFFARRGFEVCALEERRLDRARLG
ncbi:MAG: hypothetical protein JOY58_07185 [Solirubrobacterales bacterium]|nr:hypothetical protein [Solirubrobacterales bacterium]